jgi:hypothetical protein
MKHNLDPIRDAGQTHAPPEDAVMDRHAFNSTPGGEAGAGQSRRPPALMLEASPAKQKDWRTTKTQDREAPELFPKACPDETRRAKAYRARMLEKVANDPERSVNFTDEELESFIAHAEGLGFGQEDIEAILSVKVRKPGVECVTLMDVANCILKKRDMEWDIFENGWDFMRAYREAQDVMLSGGVLAPETYLSQEYLDMHKESFSNFASYLITTENYIKYIVDEEQRTPNLGFKGALYISTVGEIDRILAEAGNDIGQIERNLGITSGAWQGKGGLWRVDLIKPEEHLLRMPTGAEASANEYWTPGGFTSGGTLEAVVAEVPKEKGVTYDAEQVVFENNSNNLTFEK